MNICETPKMCTKGDGNSVAEEGIGDGWFPNWSARGYIWKVRSFWMTVTSESVRLNGVSLSD